MVTPIGFVLQELDVYPTFLYGELKETIYICLPAGYNEARGFN
jgi:hypothetical protein